MKGGFDIGKIQATKLPNSKRLYGIWRHMMERCYDKDDRYYPRYGGRGIHVYDGWKDYHSFKTWAFANGYNGTMTIDRLDNDGNYEPSNCEWVDAKTQANNTSRNHLLTYMGVTRTMAEWAEEFGINYNTLNVRIHRGWSVERALTEPKRGRYVR